MYHHLNLALIMSICVFFISLDILVFSFIGINDYHILSDKLHLQFCTVLTMYKLSPKWAGVDFV